MKKTSEKACSVKLSLLIAFLTLSSNLYAIEDARHWQRIGPEGGEISSFLSNQNHPEVIYASSKAGTYFKSNNAGKSWVALPNIHSHYLPLGLKSGLAIDPVTPNGLYAYSSEGLIKSSDK